MSKAVSIIIPVYNVQKYLKICLDSILRQTFQDFEIICINDGSTDNSLSILEEYKSKDNRFVIINKKNEGPGCARNIGLETAKGKYIQFLDSDDYFEPEMLAAMYAEAEENNADVVVCSARKVNEFGQITESGNPNFPINLDQIPSEKLFNYKNLPNNFFSLLGSIVWNKLYLRQMLIENDIKFPNLIASEDVGFVCMSGACAKRVVILKNEFINYRFNRVGSIQSNRANHAIDVIKSALAVKEFLKQKGLFDELKKSWENTYIGSARWETTLCSKEQYKEFEGQLKEIMPNDWRIFSSVINKTLTIDQLNNFIGNKKVMLWGASYYLRNLLKDEKTQNSNILGIIDRNSASWGENVSFYKIYPPEAINELKPEYILLTAHNNHEIIYQNLKEDLNQNFPNVNLLPNIFEEELC